MDFVVTADGSSTLYHAEVGEHYHSKHGALQESKHVFVQSGLAYYIEKENTNTASILEIGFGTGLNFLQSADYASRNKLKLNYCGIEAYPLAENIIFGTGYDRYVTPVIWQSFSDKYSDALHQSVNLNTEIAWEVVHSKVLEFDSDRLFDIIYFDAFAAIHQPEMWTDETLAHVCQYLRVGGVFVTYAITGNLKRSMKALGFKVEKAPGAPGKREMLRAVKQ
ncbi:MULTISPECIES: tRNA (5-methylaminomethyl-2-thiouridine)(34)-methyltransferase MnmD [Sphingobacterium]|uniref:tRNA (5-methylaminomethyl-2-thiouridine)(34)-methyltransferase MnmD n=1 Tax=Sphingobacterium TaxID=28453 RepID=UPI0013D9DC1C|nr:MULTISPECIES: tRNA (5-methylaminomethyl-2-thiouridine)(34)-methyltransferase MnmD [unclassified Sphingobacterium]